MSNESAPAGIAGEDRFVIEVTADVRGQIVGGGVSPRRVLLERLQSDSVQVPPETPAKR